MKRILAALTAVFTLTSGLTVFAAEPDAPQEPILPPLPSITVDMEGDKKPISPYIYGVNDNYANENYDLVSPKSLRQGGNRTTGYNWETNYSNAGADWEHYNDDYMNMNLPEDIKFLPGAPALNVANIAKERNIGYKATTLQMAGYVAADMGIEGRNPVLEEEAAPSPRWKEVVARKGSDFVLDPDKDDDYVYMDEYVNYLVETLGDSQNGGFNGYLLDNDPALWSETHPRIHPEKTGAKELVDKGIELAGAVKDVDPNAEIIGPVLFGFGAYSNLAEAPDWEDVKGEHEWYVSYYLDQMAQAEEEAGRRLLDVFDVHYYSEAYTGLELNENNQYQTTGHRVSNCPLEDCEECAAERLQIVRTLWDSTYVNNFDEIPNVWDGAVHRGEKSWVNQWLFGFLPVLPRIQSDIEKYYPGTKLGITEYNFGGGNNISGAIAQADALGVFGQQGVYLANLWALTN
ncbi:MAG: glycoside hydrolase family 44 protein, partial [Oscillospiraceae bacterium]|nr:glycoside hydrolase family 44 protein [Oscillospiraceae bacterium]